MTTVLVVMTSTANGRLPEFAVGIQSIVLTDGAGTPAVLYDNVDISGSSEYMDLNGVSQFFLAVSIPQGTYTAASVSLNYCNFTTVAVDTSGSLTEASYSTGSGFTGQYCGLGSAGYGSAVVQFPSSISIAGPLAALSLNLQVPQSYTLNTVTSPATFTISPVFTLTKLETTSGPADEWRTKFAIRGITVNSGSNDSLVAPYDPLLTIHTDSGTVWDGGLSFTNLGSFAKVNLEVVIQPDASLLATRIAPVVASSEYGPMTLPGPDAGEFSILELGCTAVVPITSCAPTLQYNSDTVFGVSRGFGNLPSLPFAATFDAVSFFPGQNVSAEVGSSPPPENEQPVSKVTLIPQTINGMVTAVSTEDGFTAYTVSLPPYDVIPTLQGLKSLTTHLNAPNIVTVYADANAELLNTTPIVAGGVFRFRGLLFSDGGNLRMDCGEIYDGVPE